jgi:hypothetical protein
MGGGTRQTHASGTAPTRRMTRRTHARRSLPFNVNGPRQPSISSVQPNRAAVFIADEAVALPRFRHRFKISFSRGRARKPTSTNVKPVEAYWPLPKDQHPLRVGTPHHTEWVDDPAVPLPIKGSVDNPQFSLDTADWVDAIGTIEALVTTMRTLLRRCREECSADRSKQKRIRYKDVPSPVAKLLQA